LLRLSLAILFIGELKVPPTKTDPPKILTTFTAPTLKLLIRLALKLVLIVAMVLIWKEAKKFLAIDEFEIPVYAVVKSPPTKRVEPLAAMLLTAPLKLITTLVFTLPVLK
jgi:hypothetical protein